MSKKISEATLTTPAYTDMLPFARPDDETRRHLTAAELTGLAGGWVYVEDVRDAGVTIELASSPDSDRMDAGVWIITNPYTTDAEIRKITAASGVDLTVGALANSVAAGTPALIIDRPVASVKWFGAIGGVTGDDITAFDTAISEVSNMGGGDVFIPAEIYRVTETITLDDDVSLVGMGPASQIYVDLASDSKGIRAFQKSNVTLKNFRAYSAEDSEIRLIEISDSDDVWIDQLELERSGDLDTGCSIMVMNSASRVKITDCRIDDINLAILLQCETASYGWGNDVLISGNTITGKKPTPNGNELVKVDRGYEEVRIVNNHISGEIIYSAITVEEGARDVLIANNQIIFQTSPTTWLASTAYALGDIVVPTTVGVRYYECTVAGTSGGGEPSWTTTLGDTEVDNTVTWECRNFLWYGIRITAAQAVGLDDVDYVYNLTIDGNQIMHGRYGIWVGSKASATDLVISNNFMRGQYTDAIFGCGDGVSILNNTIINNGIYFLAAERVNIIGNTIDHPGATGINASQFTSVQDDWVIADNVIIGFSTSGINIRYVDGLVIKDNILITDETLAITSDEFPIHIWDANTADVHCHGNYFKTPNSECCIRVNAISGTFRGNNNYGTFSSEFYSFASVSYICNDYLRTLYLTAAPTAGTWDLGDIVWDRTPVAGETVGWVCTVAGAPGTWKTFGAITA